MAMGGRAAVGAVADSRRGLQPGGRGPAAHCRRLERLRNPAAGNPRAHDLTGGQIGDTMASEMLKRSVLVLLTAAVVAACSSGQSPTAPTTITAAPPPIVVPLPTTVPGVLTLVLPIDAADLATTAFGIAPYGYHGADHAEDGHPGWDVEYRLGGIVRAAAAGMVQSVFPDPSVAGRSTVQIEHVIGTHFYRTVYTNLASVTPEIIPAAAVRAGQSLGVAGTVSQTVGTTPITYAMTHFQLDDFEYYREIPNPNAVTPEPFLAADAKLFFDRIFSGAVFSTELVEPYASNQRDLRFPASRTWTRVSGDGPAGIRFTRVAARNPNYDYAILAESGTAIETGTVTLALTARPFPSIDLVSATGRRLGVYDIVSDQMRLVLANPGASRPVDVNAASTYRTPR
ncbi:MAG: hypothetical protein EXQ50_09155 [Acidobacteria bacterium]|nr:hypothetical protein [Acidobacteriota bacterium]